MGGGRTRTPEPHPHSARALTCPGPAAPGPGHSCPDQRLRQCGRASSCASDSAAEVVSVSEVGQLMVLDHDGRFVGSPSEEDLVRAMLPGFDDVTALVGTLANAFRAGTCIKLQAVPRTRSTWPLGKETRGDKQVARGHRRP